MAGKELTTGEVARLLSVSEATVKRWADKRLLRSEKTAGGHRRFRPASIAGLMRGQGLDAASSGSLTETRAALVSTHERRAMSEARVSSFSMLDALVQGHAEEAAAFLINHHLHGHTLAHIFDEILSQVMRRIGDLWYQGDLTVAQEHLATSTAEKALHRLSDVMPVREANGLLAICCGLESDFHELPVQFSQALLESEGWQTISLGANTPLFALTEAMLRHGPTLVCVASAIFNNPDRAAREYEEVRGTAARLGTAIVLGGAGFKDHQLRQRFPADLHADNFQQLSEFATSLRASKKSEG
ncbi:MAG: MerR family transcriptional regulator, light-induced transcriptional regulator [Blastocatellia bacterium]|nr:MerR family transcriptional regulator, light-induced transcriptional regulator [Blastocatellia bacterium]